MRKQCEFELCDQLGVDYCGINLVPTSIRYLPVETAITETKATKCNLVLIFRDAAIESILTAVNKLRLTTAIQLHGNETVETIAHLRKELPQIAIWKAIGVSQAADIIRAEEFSAYADLVLFDYRGMQSSGNFGGEGRTFDWGLVRTAPRLPKVWGLSGGIRLENISEAMASGPDLIDIASGIEVQRGLKSNSLMKSVFETFMKVHNQVIK